MAEKFEWLSENEQLAKIQETYKRLIALDFDNWKKEDIDSLDKNNISWIKNTIKDYKNNFSKENSKKINKILDDIKDFETDAKINNISVDFNQNFEANIPDEWEFWFALAYEKLVPPITDFKEYNINSYIHYVSVVKWEWTDRNLVILEWEVYSVEYKNNEWTISEEPLDDFEVKDFKIIENRDWMTIEQKKKDAEKFDEEKTEKYWIEDKDEMKYIPPSLSKRIYEMKFEWSYSNWLPRDILKEENYVDNIEKVFEEFTYINESEYTNENFTKEWLKEYYYEDQDRFMKDLLMRLERSDKWQMQLTNILNNSLDNVFFRKSLIKNLNRENKFYNIIYNKLNNNWY